MTLSDIETTIEELLVRHPDLNKDLLVTLLTSANWEERNIKEALMLFDGRALVEGSKHNLEVSELNTSEIITKPNIVLADKSSEGGDLSEKGELHDDMVFYTPDGDVEKDVHLEPEGESFIRDKKEDMNYKTPHDSEDEKPKDNFSLEESIVPPVATSEVRHEETVPSEVQKIEEMPILQEVRDLETPASTRESLLPSKDQNRIISAQTQEKDIPHNLPMLPFESSPHIWSFSKYKDVFHKEKKEEPVYEKVLTPVFSESATPVITVMPQEDKGKEKEIDDVVIEEVPLSKGDESLVFLAGVMLIAILLILGYMYGNGRL